ncbi:MAG: hypothetical protein PHV59_09715 [Victivallales bacterium]|nr:hypothetical protein [Victivallales bacterium]
MDVFQDAMRELNEQLDAYAATEVVYVRADGTRLPVLATIGRTRFRYTDRHGSFVVTETRDFLISASYLESDPDRGDTIEDGGFVYQVSAPNREPFWSWSDEQRLCRRIHAVLIDDEVDDE